MRKKLLLYFSAAFLLLTSQPVFASELSGQISEADPRPETPDSSADTNHTKEESSVSDRSEQAETPDLDRKDHTSDQKAEPEETPSSKPSAVEKTEAESEKAADTGAEEETENDTGDSSETEEQTSSDSGKTDSSGSTSSRSNREEDDEESFERWQEEDEERENVDTDYLSHFQLIFNLLLVSNLLQALSLGCLCASIFSRYLSLRG